MDTAPRDSGLLPMYLGLERMAGEAEQREDDELEEAIHAAMDVVWAKLSSRETAGLDARIGD